MTTHSSPLASPMQRQPVRQLALAPLRPMLALQLQLLLPSPLQLPRSSSPTRRWRRRSSGREGAARLWCGIAMRSWPRQSGRHRCQMQPPLPHLAVPHLAISHLAVLAPPLHRRLPLLTLRRGRDAAIPKLRPLALAPLALAPLALAVC